MIQAGFQTVQAGMKNNIAGLQSALVIDQGKAVSTKTNDNELEQTGSDPWSALIVRIAEAADEHAFKTLYNHFAPRVKSFSLSRGCTPGLAEEIAQETLIMVWRKAASFKPERAKASTWIFTIARNKSIDHFRKLGRKKPTAEELYSDPFDAYTPEDAAQGTQAHDIIHTALKTLPPEQRDILTLSFLKEEPHSAISEKLGLPLGTVKSRIRLGLQKLHHEIDTLEGRNT